MSNMTYRDFTHKPREGLAKIMYNIRLTQLPPLNLSNHVQSSLPGELYHFMLQTMANICETICLSAIGSHNLLAEAAWSSLKLRKWLWHRSYAGTVRAGHRYGHPVLHMTLKIIKHIKAQMLAHKDAMSNVTTKYFPNKSVLGCLFGRFCNCTCRQDAECLLCLRKNQKFYQIFIM